MLTSWDSAVNKHENATPDYSEQKCNCCNLTLEDLKCTDEYCELFDVEIDEK